MINQKVLFCLSLIFITNFLYSAPNRGKRRISNKPQFNKSMLDEIIREKEEIAREQKIQALKEKLNALSDDYALLRKINNQHEERYSGMFPCIQKPICHSSSANQICLASPSKNQPFKPVIHSCIRLPFLSPQ